MQIRTYNILKQRMKHYYKRKIYLLPKGLPENVRLLKMVFHQTKHPLNGNSQPHPFRGIIINGAIMAQYNINTKLNAFLFSRRNFSAALVNRRACHFASLRERSQKIAPGMK